MAAKWRGVEVTEDKIGNSRQYLPGFIAPVLRMWLADARSGYAVFLAFLVAASRVRVHARLCIVRCMRCRAHARADLKV
jgi:hypothetical protein